MTKKYNPLVFAGFDEEGTTATGTVTSVAGGVGITGTPEPIVGAGTLDLDINSLTTGADPLAAGDLFPFVDVSVGTSPSSQRKVAFSAIESALTLANLSGNLAPARISPQGAASGLDADLLDGQHGSYYTNVVTSVFGRTGAVVAAINDYAHSQLSGIGANDHHNQSHLLATNIALGGDHTISGCTAGQFLRASAATTANFQAIAAADLPGGGYPVTSVFGRTGAVVAAINDYAHNQLSGIGANDHHNQSHVLATNLALGPDHTISGATAGHFLRASAATAANFAAIGAADLPSHTHATGDITSGTLAVARGGTNLASGTSGGILGYTAAGVLASSALLTDSVLLVGGGAGATPTSLAAGLGTTTTLLHGNAAGEPTWAAVNLAAGGDVTGTLPIGSGGTGQTTQQAAIDALTAVAGAVNEHVLTKDTATGNAIFKAAAGGAAHNLLSATHTDTTAATPPVRGDVITGQGVAPTWTRLAVGVANQILKNDGTDVVWGKVDLADDTAEVTGVLAYNHGGTGQSAWAQGDLLYASAINVLSKLTIGGANTVLVSNGTIPGWSATLAGLTLTTPTIASFANATHTHQNAAGGGTLDHGLALTGLTDDDHTQYALLAGRGAGQTLRGGVNSGNSLVLQPNSVDPNAGHLDLDGELDIRDSLSSLAALTTYNCVLFDSTIATAGTLVVLNPVNFSPTLSVLHSSFSYYPINLGGTLTYGTGSGSNLTSMVYCHPVLNTGATALVGITAPTVLRDATTLRSSHTTSTYVGTYSTVISLPTFDSTATGTDFLLDHRGFQDIPMYVAAVGRSNLFTRYGHYFGLPVSSGAGTNYQVGSCALFVADQTLTNLISRVSAVESAMNANSVLHYNLFCNGTAPSAHLGPVVAGAAAQPTNASVGLELQSTTKAFLLSRMTTAQRDTLTGVAIADGMLLYNSTLNRVQSRAGSQWVSLPGEDIVIIKSANQTVTNNSVLQDDTELQFTVGAEEVWHVDLYLGMSGNTALGDGKVCLTAAVASFVTTQSNWDGVFYSSAGALTTQAPIAFASTTQSVTAGTTCIDGNSTIWPIRLRYRFRCSAATTVKVQFANSSAAAGRTTTMHAGSMLVAKRITT